MNEKSDTQRILVVDDVPTNIKVLLPTLKPHYDVSIATDGKRALQVAEAQRPDLILLDIIMPGMDGYDVCRRLKEGDSTRDIPVIFITAKDDEADEMTGLALGAVDYITKPFSTAIVLARIKTHIGLKKAREEIEQQNQQLIEAGVLRDDVNRIMRHDLKTPLNAIIGFSDLLLANDKCASCDPDHPDFLKIIRESGYRLLEMINISLDLYKMEQGTYVLEPKPIDLVVIIEKIIQTLQNHVTVKRLRVDVRVEQAAPEGGKESFVVLGEELLCYSLLANLIKNAFEAAPSQSVIHISMKPDVEGGIVLIHNEGVVPDDIVEHFFDKYVTSGKSQGTGLGTYSAQLIAKTHRGSIAMETSVKAGTTLKVRLPRG